MHPFGAGSRKWCPKKHPSSRNHSLMLESFFEIFVSFRRFIFQQFLRCPQIPNFRHFGAERVPKRRFSGSLFGAIPRLVAKERMKLPCGRQHRFRGFRTPKKRQISPLFPEGVRGSSGAPFSHAFYDFGCPPGSKKEPILELASVFFSVRDFAAFRGFGCRGRRQRVCPRNPSIC